MKVVRFHLTMQDYPDVQRVIDLRHNHSFDHFHNAILKSVEFDNSQLASFFICTDKWDKKLEITLIDMSNDESDVNPIMQDTLISDYVDHKGQKLIYEYDFVLMWRFLIEVVDILEAEDKLIYPLVVESHGKAPDQYETPERYPSPVTEEDEEVLNAGRKKIEIDFFAGDFEEEEDPESWDSYDEFDRTDSDEEESY